jgi:hypothetical protein
MFTYTAFFAMIMRYVLLKQDDISLLADIGPALLLVLAMGIISFGLLVFYIIHVINSKTDNNEKILWMFFFITCSILAFPIYWYMRVWKSPAENMPMIAKQ